ncbi:phage tail sheath family protein [uncultured Secundilactobacillus sp.]|uniref:phage tail sheath family protein n=1 Tax=uncultured Secundilactobacillus sp. TaxID=2813935 RepID=UPI00258CE421|nr:phage tail sheath family protein [uncultured Secundilactobacillus sp.]
MAGGTWTKQNKVRPGAYINTKSAPTSKPDTSIGRTLLIGSAVLNWGANGVIELDSDSDFKALLGTDLTDSRLVALRETLKGALTVLYLNANAGEKAKAEEAALPWSFTAKYPGTLGNSLSVNVEKDPNDETRITVSTLLGTEIVDQQVVRTTTASGLESNSYLDITFTGDNTEPTPKVTAIDGGADFSAKAGKDKLEALPGSTNYVLAGGSTTESDDLADLIDEAMGSEVFQVVTTAGNTLDSEIHSLVAQAATRLRNDEGYKILAVVPQIEGGQKYDTEAVTDVLNGVVLEDGTTVEAKDAAGWFAGASSAAGYKGSLTAATYPGAVSAYPKLNNELIIDALEDGHVVFAGRRDGTVVVEQDINTLTTFTKDKGAIFHKNRTLRTMDYIANNTYDVFHTAFIGKVDNNGTGRDLFKANRVAFLKNLQANGAIRDFDATVDIEVLPGNDKDAIVVNLAITVVDAMEKLYMTITVA